MTQTGPTTRDAFLGGRLILEQPAKGHRVGTDAVLLAAAAGRDFVGHVHDAGAGIGAVGLAVAFASPRATVTLIENDPVSVALAGTNIAANGLGARVGVAACDLLSKAARRASLPVPADLVVTNPPFDQAARVRPSPDAARRAAHVMAGDHGLADWVGACLDGLGPRGTLIVVHRADAVPVLLACLERRAGEVTLKPIYPRAHEPATRVLIRARKGSRAPFRIVAPLVLHNLHGVTPEAAALHTGTAMIDW